MEQEVVITYETLFEILRREKSREELQELPENFSEEVKKYLAEKKQTMLSLAQDQFSDLEQEKTQKQILNIKKILNEMYERREKKIINMALNKSRMPRSVIDTSKLAGKEKELYNNLISTFTDARQEVLKDVLLESIASPKQEHTVPVENKPEIPLEPVSEAEETEPQQGEKASFKIADNMQKVKFICDISQFVGPNLEIYGPFKSSEIAILPQAVCNVLLNKEKAEIVENGAQEE